MTWREKIQAAHAAVEAAEAERTRILREAHDAGLSTREIASVLPVNHSTVFRWMGRNTGQPGATLDSEAFDSELRAVIDKHLTSPDQSPLRGLMPTSAEVDDGDA